jgi:dTDP-4-dehydrorhamnose 3,5-epimerase-like enzyme
MNYHEDDRAQRLLDVFPLDKGQVDVSYINSTEPIVAWHKHEKPTDYWICIKGSLKVGWATEEEGCEFKYLSDKNPHALEPNTILAYYVTHQYDPTDEYRVPIGHFDEKWETENK